MKKKLIVLIITLTISNLFGQKVKYKFTHFNEQAGLSSNVVNCLMQDDLGYIWIGTSNGVTKFDGYEFTNFNVVPKDTNFLQLPLTTSFFEDSKGNIWIGSVDGVTKYDRTRKTFKLFSFAKLSQKIEALLFPTDMEETKDGNILCTVGDFHFFGIKNGLFLIDVTKNTINEVNISNEDSTNILTQISPLHNEKYLVSGVNGLTEYDYKKNIIKKYPFREQIPIMTFLPDGNENLWLGTYEHGLIHYNLENNDYTKFKVFDSLITYGPNFLISKIIYESPNTLLITSNKGLIQFNSETKKIAIAELDSKNPFALHSNNLTDIILDNSGSIWISSKGLGISKFDKVKNNFKAYTSKTENKNSIAPGWINKIFEFNENELWLSTGYSIDRFNIVQQSFKRGSIAENSEVFDIVKTTDDIILFLGFEGVYKLDPNKWNFDRVKLPFDLNNEVVFTALEVDSKTIWFGTSAGIYIYDEINNAATNIDFRTLGIGDITSNSVQILVRDKENSIWIGTDNGLYKYDSESKLFSRIGYSKESNQALTSQDVNSIYIDEENNIWIGTWLGGLNKFDHKSQTFESYTQKDGLKSHSVQAILGDEENNDLWLSTFAGISRFDLEKKSFSNFGVEDGLHSSQFADRSALKTKTGLFAFGGSNGITVFDPKNIQNNLIPPKVTITDFRLFNNLVLPGANSPLDQPIYKTKRITLNYDENDIELKYFAAHYVDPQKNQYAYKLKNFEDDWRYVGNQRSAIYPNLPPGNYVFHLKASNNNEVWNEAGVELDIIILPPWWKTTWAYIAYFLLFVMGVIIVDRLQRKRLLAKAKERMKIQDAEYRAKTAELQSKVIQAENDRKTKELEEARELQLSMLPKDLPQLPNLEIAAYMKTATEVGGDYYDFSIKENGSINICLGDATGHGMKAGTLVSMIKSIFTIDSTKVNIDDFFISANSGLKSMALDKMMMAFGMTNINGNKIQIANAGIPPVFIYRNEKQYIEEVKINGLPLGAMNNSKYEIYESELSIGDVILMLSDGFPELQNENNEMYGYDRVVSSFQKIANKSSEEIIDYLKTEGSKWLKDNDPDDDVTFVVLKVK